MRVAVCKLDLPGAPRVQARLYGTAASMRRGVRRAAGVDNLEDARGVGYCWADTASDMVLLFYCRRHFDLNTIAHECTHATDEVAAALQGLTREAFATLAGQLVKWVAGAWRDVLRLPGAV